MDTTVMASLSADETLNICGTTAAQDRRGSNRLKGAIRFVQIEAKIDRQDQDPAPGQGSLIAMGQW